MIPQEEEITAGFERLLFSQRGSNKVKIRKARLAFLTPQSCRSSGAGKTSNPVVQLHYSSSGVFFIFYFKKSLQSCFKN